MIKTYTQTCPVCNCDLSVMGGKFMIYYCNNDLISLGEVKYNHYFCDDDCLTITNQKFTADFFILKNILRLYANKENQIKIFLKEFNIPDDCDCMEYFNKVQGLLSFL